MEKFQVQARAMQPGDVTGSGETVVSVQVGVRTPRDKVEVVLDKNGRTRLSYWGAYTMIWVRRTKC